MKAKIMLIFSANQRHFHLQKSLDSFDKNSADKNLIQKGQGSNVPTNPITRIFPHWPMEQI